VNPEYSNRRRQPVALLWGIDSYRGDAGRVDLDLPDLVEHSCGSEEVWERKGDNVVADYPDLPRLEDMISNLLEQPTVNFRVC
jgi:hypothetical protein